MLVALSGPPCGMPDDYCPATLREFAAYVSDNIVATLEPTDAAHQVAEIALNALGLSRLASPMLGIARAAPADAPRPAEPVLERRSRGRAPTAGLRQPACRAGAAGAAATRPHGTTGRRPRGGGRRPAS